MSDFCRLCCYNDAYIFFDDSEYSLPPYSSLSYVWTLITGYNHVINRNGFNPVLVCYDCLLEKIYECNFDIYNEMLKSLKLYFVLQEIGKQKDIPLEIIKEIQNFLTI